MNKKQKIINKKSKVRQVKLLISGKVQGVFLRQSVFRYASQLGVQGYTQNLANGQVLVEAWGAEAALKKLVEFCQNNPGHSEVEKVMVEWLEEGQSVYNDFIIKKG